MTTAHSMQIGLLKAIHADLDASLPRQGSADWLEEQRNSGTAATMRLVDTLRPVVYARKPINNRIKQFVQQTGVTLEDRHQLIQNQRLDRWWSCDCVAAVLHLFEERYPDVTLPRESIQAAREYILGIMSEKKMTSISGLTWSLHRDQEGLGTSWSAVREAFRFWQPGLKRETRQLLHIGRWPIPQQPICM